MSKKNNQNIVRLHVMMVRACEQTAMIGAITDFLIFALHVFELKQSRNSAHTHIYRKVLIKSYMQRVAAISIKNKPENIFKKRVRAHTHTHCAYGTIITVPISNSTSSISDFRIWMSCSLVDFPKRKTLKIVIKTVHFDQIQ